MRPLTAWLMKRRFTILCLLVFGVMGLHTRNQLWGCDFWEHCAAVRELATHILHPKHPQLLLDVPHTFYSPYAVLVAVLARSLRVDAVAALSIMGLINLGLLLAGLRLFVSAMVPRHQGATAFYALLLTLFYWGSAPWDWSGFFHINVLRYVLPYPSTFAAALALIGLALNQRRIKAHEPVWLLPIFLIAVTVLISHPTAFLCLAVGLVSQAWGERGAIVVHAALAGGILGLAFLVAMLWPYFDFLELFTGGPGMYRAAYHAECRAMYMGVVARIWPALIGVPLAIASMRADRRRPSAWLLLLLSGIYAAGAISGNYGYGRVLPYMVLLLHVAMAEYLAMLECRIQEVRPSPHLLALAVPASTIAMALLLAWQPLGRTLDHALHRQSPSYAPYRFLSQFTRQYDVVLSDIETSWVVPAFGGKVIATLHPLAFVPDHDARKSDLERFFDGQTTLGERQKIIRKYGADYVLIKKSGDGSQRELPPSSVPGGKVVYTSNQFVLVEINPAPDEDAPPR